MLPAEFAQTINILEDINIDQETIDEITRVLRTSRDTLGEPVGDMDTAPLEGSNGSETFARNAELAREHLMQAMKDMVSSLYGFEDSVGAYQRAQEANDTTTATDLRNLQGLVDQSLTCAGGPTQGTTTPCVPIPAPSGGN